SCRRFLQRIITVATLQRWDIVELRKPEKLPNGFLKVDALIARSGTQEYVDASTGQKRIEYRDAKEVFDPKSLRSFAMVPVTNDHAPVGLLDGSNARQYSVGSTSENVVRQGDHVRTSLMLTDAETIAQVLAGKNQLSCSYTADVEESPGISPDGIPYTHVQK